jgi:hypothetical protein
MPHLPTSRPPRRGAPRLATALSALALAAVALGTTAGIAHARVNPHTSELRRYRVLSVVTRNIHVPVNPIRRITELQYTSPHQVRYLLVRRYSGSRRTGWKLVDSSWQKDFLGRPPSDITIKINAAKRTWVEREGPISPLPAPPLGIQSSRRAVKRAIQQNNAYPIGLTRIDGQRVRLLLVVPTGPDQHGINLWVNASTDQPVREAEAFSSGRYSYSATSSWERISQRALNRLRAKPRVPAGYSTSRS